MTHTLHREGSIESMKEDFAVLVRSERGYNDEGSAPKLKRALDLMIKNNAVNYGQNYEAGVSDKGKKRDFFTGNKFIASTEQIRDALRDGQTIYGVFANSKDLANFLKDIKEVDLGLSVVVAGLYDVVQECCQEIGTKVHTTNHSLGVWGNRSKLAPDEIRPITTMCGHGMVPASLVKDVIQKIREGKLSIEEGAAKLARPCMCSVFNPAKAQKLLKEIIDSKS